MRHLSPMGRQRLLLGCSLTGVVLGAALIGVWAAGAAVVADSVFGVWFALFRDVPGPRWEEPGPGVYEVPQMDEVLERAWRAP